MKSLTGIVWRDRVGGPEGENLIERYEAWRDQAEQDALNKFGNADFELVSVMRHEVSEIVRHDHTVRLPVSEVEVYCYFKRESYPDAPAPPIVSFQPVRGRDKSL